MSESNPFEIVKVDENKDAYKQLTIAYLKWIHDPDCDENYKNEMQIGKERRHVTFMRDDSIGDPREPEEGDNKPNKQEINGPIGTDVFFPVYYFHSSIGEGNGRGGKCEKIEDCVEAAKYDLGKIKRDDHGKKKIWAKIRKLSEDENKEVDITSDFNDHAVTIEQFTIKVPDNRLNREPEFHLKPDRPYESVVLGTFIYLRNFKKGDYYLKFGGKASNFVTRSEYTLHVN